MEAAALYAGGLTPERQFARALVARKQAVLDARSGHGDRDLVLRVALGTFLDASKAVAETAPPVWRRVRVSGACTLAQLHARALRPAMGYDRRNRCYFFTDLGDGATWCASSRLASADRAAALDRFGAALDPAKTRVGAVLRVAGDVLGYAVDDFRDPYEHVVRLERVARSDASTHATVLEAGALRCPDAGGGGTAAYARAVLAPWDACGRETRRVAPRFAVGARVEVEGPAPDDDDLSLDARPWRPGVVEALDVDDDGAARPRPRVRPREKTRGSREPSRA